MPKIIFRPNPVPPPFVPPTPPIGDNAIVFNGLTEGSLVTANYDFWNQYIKNLEPEYPDTTLAYITFDMYSSEYGDIFVRLNTHEDNLLKGFLESTVDSLQVSDVIAQSTDESTYPLEGYQLVLL